MSEIDAANAQAVPSRAKASRHRQRHFAWGAVAITVLLDLVYAVSSFVDRTAPLSTSGIIAAVVGRWVNEVHILFPLSLYIHLLDILPLGDSYLARSLSHALAMTALSPLAYVTGTLLYRAGHIYGWKFAVPGYLVLSLLTAAVSYGVGFNGVKWLYTWML